MVRTDWEEVCASKLIDGGRASVANYQWRANDRDTADAKLSNAQWDVVNPIIVAKAIQQAPAVDDHTRGAPASKTGRCEMFELLPGGRDHEHISLADAFICGRG